MAHQSFSGGTAGGHSADVSLTVRQGGQQFALRQVGGGRMYFRSAVVLSPGQAELTRTVDGKLRRWNITIKPGSTPTDVVAFEFRDTNAPRQGYLAPAVHWIYSTAQGYCKIIYQTTNLIRHANRSIDTSQQLISHIIATDFQSVSMSTAPTMRDAHAGFICTATGAGK